MSNNSKFRKVIAGALLSGGMALAGLGLGSGAAQADNFTVPHDWCPGQPLPMPDVRWDMGVCHHWYWVPVGGMGNVGQFVWEGDAPRRPLGPPPCYGAPICLPGL